MGIVEQLTEDPSKVKIRPGLIVAFEGSADILGNLFLQIASVKSGVVEYFKLVYFNKGLIFRTVGKEIITLIALRKVFKEKGALVGYPSKGFPEVVTEFSHPQLFKANECAVNALANEVDLKTVGSLKTKPTRIDLHLFDSKGDKQTYVFDCGLPLKLKQLYVMELVNYFYNDGISVKWEVVGKGR